MILDYTRDELECKQLHTQAMHRAFSCQNESENRYWQSELDAINRALATEEEAESKSKPASECDHKQAAIDPETGMCMMCWKQPGELIRSAEANAERDQD